MKMSNKNKKTIDFWCIAIIAIFKIMKDTKNNEKY